MSKRILAAAFSVSWSAPNMWKPVLGFGRGVAVGLMSEHFPFCEKLPGFKPYHVYAAVTSKFSCWTWRFSVHWKAKPVPLLIADQCAGEQTKQRWICHALVRDRGRDRWGGVKQVGRKTGVSLSKQACHMAHPLERNPRLLSARVLVYSAARGGSPTLPRSFGMFLLGNPWKITQASFPLDQLPDPAPHEDYLMCSWHFKGSRSTGQRGLCFPAGRCPTELAGS